jgi:acetylornithine deacetylase
MMTPLAESALAILDRLIAFDTVSRNSNLPLVAYVSDYLTGHGIAHDVLPSPDGNKANVLATIGPADRPGIVLSGHTDVVPVDGQTWAHNPFRLTRVGDRLYGRGTSDMKGYVACVLALAPLLAGVDLRLPVHLALSYDEEVGCYGVHGIVEHMRHLGLRPGAALIGEPSRMGVVNGHKGSCGMLTRVNGASCHSSRPELGVNAVFHAMDIMTDLRARGDAFAAAPDSVGVFDPPYTSISVGVIRGGTARNAIPGDCGFEWDIRATRPGVAEAVQQAVQQQIDATVLPAMRARNAGCTVVTEMVYDVPPLVPQPGCAAEALAKTLSGANATGTVPYGSEAGVFQLAGIPSVICGPGDIAQAHTPDEWIEVAQIEACTEFLERLLAHVSAA